MDTSAHLSAAQTAIADEARDLLIASGVSTDAILLDLLRQAEVSFQTYDITGDERGRFPGADLHKASLVVALVNRTGARDGSTDEAIARQIGARLEELARRSSLLYNASESLRYGLGRARVSGGSWHVWPLDDRHLGVERYEEAMTASTFSYFHELIRDNPVTTAIIKAAEVEVEDRCRYRKGGDITGPRHLPALNKLVQHDADLLLRAMTEDLSFLTDPAGLLENGMTVRAFSQAMSGLFALLHRRRLILKNWAMRHPDDAGQGLVVVRKLGWYAREVARHAEISVDTAEAGLSLVGSSPNASNPSDHFLQRRPLVALGDGRLMSGCHAIQALRFAFLAVEHFSSEARSEMGDRFALAISQRLREKGARSTANLRYDERGLRGDLDVVCLWDGRLMVAECKATSRFYLPARTANLRNAIESNAPDCAVKQVGRGLDYVRRAPRRLAMELGVPEDEVRGARLLPAVLLSGMEFDGCSADAIPIRCGPRLVRAVSSAADLEGKLAARPTVTAVDQPITVEVGGSRFVIHSTDRSGHGDGELE